MNNTNGLKFKKFDLHIHTPASNDYVNKTVTADNIVDQAVACGLAGIAITDHQNGDWVDAIKLAAKTKNLAVFPGIELKVHGGKDGIHLIILFDCDKSSSHVTAFLNTIKVYNNKGKIDVIANKTVIDVAKELQEFDKTALLILAHCDSTFGVDSDMRGEQRSNIFKPEWKCLVGAESSETNFLDEDKIKKHSRVVDLLDGTFSDFHNKKIGVYQASDSHDISTIGSRYTYFKVDDNISIEDIRQSLLDRDTRIRQSFEFKETVHPKIISMKSTGGFLDDQEFIFHEGLNSILGAKGSGKSLAIEFLRFALNQEPENIEILMDHNGKLDKCLKIHGSIEVVIMDESGKMYKVQRMYNPAESSPIRIFDLSDESEKYFNIEQIFPTLFLSQNEIIKITEDKTGGSQRSFIDKFFDFYKFQQKIENLISELKNIDRDISDVLDAHIKTLELNKKISTTKEEIEKLGRQIQNKVFAEYEKKEKIEQAIRGQLNFVDAVKEMLVASQSEYKYLSLSMSGVKEIDENPAVRRVNDSVFKIISDINDSFDQSVDKLVKDRALIEKELIDWEISSRSVKEQYDSLVKSSGGNQVVLDQKRKILNLSLAALEQELSKYYGKEQQVTNINDKRKDIVNKLDLAYKEFYEARKSRCLYFTDNSNGALNVTISEREDKSAFRDNLLKFKKGSWLKDEEIEIISQKISPNDFVNILLRYAWINKSKVEVINDIAVKTGIKIENIEKLAQHLLDEYTIRDILALLYTSIPRDVPIIKYKVGSEFKALNELSVGQRAVALLIIALSDGTFPIIIDQPEDSLDLRSIWDDVCSKLRNTKDQRQFIFTTHNSSVAVASDTDKFTIMQSDANNGRIMFSGSLNCSDIKNEVLEYLEGGKNTYERKRNKYNI